jgi:hypothetical protein
VLLLHAITSLVSPLSRLLPVQPFRHKLSTTCPIRFGHQQPRKFASPSLLTNLAIKKLGLKKQEATWPFNNIPSGGSLPGNQAPPPRTRPTAFFVLGFFGHRINLCHRIKQLIYHRHNSPSPSGKAWAHSSPRQATTSWRSLVANKPSDVRLRRSKNSSQAPLGLRWRIPAAGNFHAPNFHVFSSAISGPGGR